MAMRIGRHSRIDKIDAEDFAIFSEEIGVSLKTITAELHILREALANQIDGVVEEINQVAGEHLPVAEKLHEHLLKESDQRVVI